MNKSIVNTDQAPAPIGPYNQAIRSGNLLFVSGQIPVDPLTGEVVAGGTEEQTVRVMENLRAILEKASLTFDDVLSTTIFVCDLADFAIVNRIYGSYFKQESAPARQTVEVSALPKGARVEISLIAAAR